MKSFAVAALAASGVSAAWAPPAYGGAESSPVASSSVPAEEYSVPSYGEETSSVPSAPAYTQPAGYETSSKVVPSESYPTAPAYGASSSSAWVTSSKPINYGTGSSSAYVPKPTKSYGGSWGNNGTEGGYGGDSYVTQVVTSYETYCPGPTTVVQNSKTYTVTEATTLTITDCPCTQEIPATSYKPETTTKVYTSFTTTCPGKTTVTYGPSTYTVESSTVLTVTDCPGGCTVTEEVPATWVVPTMTTYCPKPEQPTTVTIGTQTYPISEATTITVTAPTSYATETSVISKPEQPTSYVIESTTYPVSEATTITYTKPTQEGYTMTGPVPVPTGYAPPAGETPVSPEQPSQYAPAPSGYPVPSGNGTSPVSPSIPEQTGNGAEKIMAGGAAVAAVFGAFFL